MDLSRITDLLQDAERRPHDHSFSRDGKPACSQYRATCVVPRLDALPRASRQTSPRAQQHMEEQRFHKHLYHDSPLLGRRQLDRTILEPLVSQAPRAAASHTKC
jgi:hypothetical protein